MTSITKVRVRLRFEMPPPTPVHSLIKCYMFLINKEEVSCISDLEHTIAHTFGFASQSQLLLSIGGFILIPNEDIDVIRDDDEITVAVEEATEGNFASEATSVGKNGNLTNGSENLKRKLPNDELQLKEKRRKTEKTHKQKKRKKVVKSHDESKNETKQESSVEKKKKNEKICKPKKTKKEPKTCKISNGNTALNNTASSTELNESPVHEMSVNSVQNEMQSTINLTKNNEFSNNAVANPPLGVNGMTPVPNDQNGYWNKSMVVVCPSLASNSIDSKRQDLFDKEEKWGSEAVQLVQDYSKLLSLSWPARRGDVIAFKLLEMTENYTPEISGFKEAKVIDVDVVNKSLHLEILWPKQEQKLPKTGRFELIYDHDETHRTPQEDDNLVTVEWNCMLEVKLIE